VEEFFLAGRMRRRRPHPFLGVFNLVWVLDLKVKNYT
jgi:hypothetical protein